MARTSRLAAILLLLASGQMPSAMKQTLVNHIAGIQRSGRAPGAMHLRGVSAPASQPTPAPQVRKDAPVPG